MKTLHLRKSTGQSPLRHALLLIPLVLIYFGLSPTMQAVSPAPDGGYPGGNTAEGASALFSLTSGGYNTAVGFFSLRSNTVGGFNTAIGAGTLLVNSGNNNTATGAGALLSNTAAPGNTANGAFALFNNIGQFNTAIGNEALSSNTTGIVNIALGVNAGGQLTTGNDNIDIGNIGVAGESGTIRVGSGFQSATYIAGIAGQTVGAGGTTCYVDNAGKLGVFLSARRFKTDIADMGAASEALLALRPVTFHYKPELDKTCIPQFGLVAEEVAAVNPDLVTQDAKGELSTVRYEAVNAMLLNEFLKEHRKVEAQGRRLGGQEATIAELKSIIARQQEAMEAVMAELKEQAAQIQKVSAQLATSKPAPQIVGNQR
jgi:hypothetical protein